MTAPHRLNFLLADSDVEMVARLREWRVIVALLVGWDSDVKRAIDTALAGGSAAVAIAAIDRLPALRRRRVLACIAALMKGARQ
jgi:hypothetical protein